MHVLICTDGHCRQVAVQLHSCCRVSVCHGIAWQPKCDSTDGGAAIERTRTDCTRWTAPESGWATGIVICVSTCIHLHKDILLTCECTTCIQLERIGVAGGRTRSDTSIRKSDTALSHREPHVVQSRCGLRPRWHRPRLDTPALHDTRLIHALLSGTPERDTDCGASACRCELSGGYLEAAEHSYARASMLSPGRRFSC